ncbi:MAG: aminotransferase class I/II-fold pyridoxal phosphate-dependent enzyme, partial [Actinobacteria bacterium]|nr:aminotransferase class I/II-fold pyridoxal phosphate-dependent enzyme [Actinomycetota bacterium]
MSKREIPGLVPRLVPLGTTVFAHYSAIAVETGAINLGQGFPDTDGPSWIADAVTRAMAEGRGNQYPAGAGVVELRKAVAAHQKRWYGIENDFATEVLITAGATEALTAALIGLVDTDDEVIVFEPFYDSYRAAVVMARGKLVAITMEAPDYTLDIDELR